MSVPHSLHNLLMDLRMAEYRVGEVESKSGTSYEITKSGNFVALVKGDEKGEKPKNNLLHRLCEISDSESEMNKLLTDYIREE